MLLEMGKHRILVVNPNSTKSMTDALKPIINDMGFNDTKYTFFTGPPESPRSIDGDEDCHASAEACLPHVLPLLAEHDAVLIACYSVHPLVHVLREKMLEQGDSIKPVVGIFEASVGAALQALGTDPSGGRFGIVSTGRVWEGILSAGVSRLLGTTVPAPASSPAHPSSPAPRFAGTHTTGLSAVELHEVAPEVVRGKVKAAVRRLVRDGRGTEDKEEQEEEGKENGKEKEEGVEEQQQQQQHQHPVRAVLLGCAGMAGMDDWVREEVGPEVYVIDGVKAGIAALQGLLRGGFLG